MKAIITLGLLFTTFVGIMAQETEMDKTSELPYFEIPAAPDNFESGSVISRMVDGLGFRYHWATEGLTESDLAFEPGNEGQTMGETLDHLYGLTQMILNTAKGDANIRPKTKEDLTWVAKRRKTLEHIAEASQLFRAMDTDAVANAEIKFKRGDNESSVPLWHLLNGPLADAIYHTGQIVSFRRTNGNPIPAGVNVFMGTKQ